MSAPSHAVEPPRTVLNTATDRWIFGIAVAVAVAYLILQRPYPGDVALKTSMCVLLAVLAFRGGLKLFAVALLFSAAGDAFLAIDGERLFVPGLASFLATHVLYAVMFVLSTRDASAPMTLGRKAMLVIIPAFAVAYSAVLWPNLGALAVPVVLYIAAIVVMAMLSLRVARSKCRSARRSSWFPTASSRSRNSCGRPRGSARSCGSRTRSRNC